MTIKTLVEFAQAVDDGKEFERGLTGIPSWETVDLVYGKYSVEYVSQLIGEGRIRIKQEPKKIDLSFLVGSGLDCEIKNSTGVWKVYGPIDEVFGDLPNYRPRMNHWSVLTIKNRNIIEELELSGFIVVVMDQYCPQEFATFKITGIAEGYTL